MKVNCERLREIKSLKIKQVFLMSKKNQACNFWSDALKKLN